MGAQSGPLRVPDAHVPVDPYSGVVVGPRLVDRTRAAREAHRARYGDDDGWPDIEWGWFTVDPDEDDVA